MSLLALPIQYINLASEMMYIIDQRLRAQNISSDRANKVRDDILRVMLDNRFMEEILHAQELYSRGALRSIFEKLAHASIMKMNSASMDKLFDLMLMGLKHQLVLCPSPCFLLTISRNHLDSLLNYSEVTQTKANIQQFYSKFLQIYAPVTIADWTTIRNTLLSFVQDIKTRVSIFLKRGIQNHFGYFVLPVDGKLPNGIEVPGTIRTFNENEEPVILTKFPTECSYTQQQITFDPHQPEHTNLGLNLYLDKDDDVSISEKVEHEIISPGDEQPGSASKELNLLAEIIGIHGRKEQLTCAPLTLFNADDTEELDGCGSEIPSTIQSRSDITIEGRIREHNALSKILQKMDTGELSESKEQDILDLLDTL